MVQVLATLACDASVARRSPFAFLASSQGCWASALHAGLILQRRAVERRSACRTVRSSIVCHIVCRCVITVLSAHSVVQEFAVAAARALLSEASDLKVTDETVNIRSVVELVRACTSKRIASVSANHTTLAFECIQALACKRLETSRCCGGWAVLHTRSVDQVVSIAACAARVSRGCGTLHAVVAVGIRARAALTLQFTGNDLETTAECTLHTCSAKSEASPVTRCADEAGGSVGACATTS